VHGGGSSISWKLSEEDWFSGVPGLDSINALHIVVRVVSLSICMRCLDSPYTFL
jgi:hypothetical protein